MKNGDSGVIRNDVPETEFESVVRKFEKQVSAHPDRTAATWNRVSLSYADLNEYANRVANALLYMRVNKGDRVLILLPRNLMYYAINLGILKAGAAFITASPTYPDERIEHIFRDSGSEFVITTKNIYRDRSVLLKKILAIPVFLETILTFRNADDPGVELSEQDLAYCIYTSGSTGRPKGVMIEHGNLSNFLSRDPRNHEVMGILSNGRVLIANAPLTFDVSIMEEFVALTGGMTAVMASTEQVLNPLLFRDQMKKGHVDTLICTPSYMNMLLSVPALHETLKEIRVFDLGAESFPAELYTKIRKVNPDAVIFNGYGPTETTISCVAKQITSRENITIGKPAANVFCFIIDEDGKELPRGEIGELLICGKGVGRGYINLPEQTERSFITFRGMRGYRSGDLARIDENGEIEFRGRMDTQVKLKGLRIELGEVESIMSGADAIDICAAMTVENRYLCLYYVLKDPACSEKQAEEEIRRYAHEHLARYMVPDLYVRLDEMPLSPNWKIDRKKLPLPEIQAIQGVAAATKMQKEIAGIFSDVLNRPCSGMDADLLLMGISSLEMMIAVSALGEKYEVPLTISDLLQCPTVLGLEQRIREKKKRNISDMVTKARPRVLHEIYDRLWRICNTSENTMACMLCLDAGTDTERLISAIRKAASVHPGLFLSCTKKGKKRMITIPSRTERRSIAANIPVDVHVTEESLMPEEERRFGSVVMEPDRLPYYQFHIYETEQHKYLGMRFAHILGDGESVSILIDDILKAYEGKEPEPEGVHIVQLAAEEELLLEPEFYEKSLSFYRKLFGQKTEPLRLPGAEEPSAPGFEDHARELSLSKKDVREFVKRLGISENIFFAALTILALARQSGCRRIPLLAAYNGRDDYRLLNTFGFLVRPAMICPELQPELPVRRLLQIIQKQFFDSVSNFFPVEELQSLCPGWTDYLFMYQESMNSTHMLEGRPVEELWVAEVLEGEDVERLQPAAAGTGEDEDLMTQIARRWAEMQTCIQVFDEDDSFYLDITSPVGMYSQETVLGLMEDIERICGRILETSAEITTGALLNE